MSSPHQKQMPAANESVTTLKPTLHPASVPFNQFTDDLIPSVEDIPRTKKTPLLVIVGQLCAYGGVALLTVGTVMVMSGHFGGPAGYAPTGWLMGAFGQMLLFLGVVTLISGGLDQTVDEVTWRIDFLAERIAHLEQTLVVRDTELRHLRKRNAGTRKADLPKEPAPNRADAA